MTSDHTTIGPALLVVGTQSSPDSQNEEREVVRLAELGAAARDGRLVRRLFRYRSVEALVPRLDGFPRPFAMTIVLRLLSRGRCVIRDTGDRCVSVGPLLLLRLARRWIVDRFTCGRLVGQVEEEIACLEATTARSVKQLFGPVSLSRPLYLRTDLWFGVAAGGSVAHTAGVVNALLLMKLDPLFVSTVDVPTVRPECEQRRLTPDRRFWDFPELPQLASNVAFANQVHSMVAEWQPGFIYQRYSLHNYTGAWLARQHRLPFVLEYNGSELWIAENWGRRLRRESLARRIELACLRFADLIVVVSRTLRDELVDRGIDPGKVLVNPNGVDTDTFRPDTDGMKVRQQLGWDDSVTVVGFIGSFSAWHGAHVLAEAFASLLRRRPELLKSVRLLMIGDGELRPMTEDRIKSADLSSCVRFVGMVAQERAPSYLAACDILICSHVDNPDGSTFFGSPTKLFEYMAMGRGIVASKLGQIGELLEHDETAWLCKPGDVSSLSEGIELLHDDVKRRERLGNAARHMAVEQFSWKQHVQHILVSLGQ